jgi:hypothetical protein
MQSKLAAFGAGWIVSAGVFWALNSKGLLRDKQGKLTAFNVIPPVVWAGTYMFARMP